MKYTFMFLALLYLPYIMLAQNHLLISEIQVSPSGDEFVEIFNPSPNSVSLDQLYLSDYNFYYKLVENDFSSETSDFLVKFPNGSMIDSAGVITIAIDGSTFSYAADFEIKGNAPAVPDMVPGYVGGSTGGLLANTSEMLILFKWDGQNDLVQDIDYVMWGGTSSNFVDKSGVSIDGPDANNTPTSYLNDTPVATQNPSTPYPNFERTTASEDGEAFSGGNGISNHDETSEPINANFAFASSPTPGTTTLEIPTGNGSGIANVTPSSVPIDSTVSLTFMLKGTIADTLTQISLKIPSTWSWTGNIGDVQLSGNGFTGSTPSANDSLISITNAKVTQQDSGNIIVHQLTSPAQAEQSLFEVSTAIAGGTPTPIANSPVVSVFEPVDITPIAEIQANPSAFTTVTVEGIVTLGAGRTITTRTDAYVQDTSGRGINVFSFDPPSDTLARGNKVRVTGTVEEYQGVTEITDFTVELLSTGNPIPDTLELTTQQANNTDLEGTYVTVKGEITDYAPNIGGGTNIRVDDGSGEALIRVWDNTAIDVSGFGIGDSLEVQAVMDIFEGATQLTPGYQDEISIPGVQPGDGTGTATISPDSVGIFQDVTEEITITGTPDYVLETVTVTIPENWQWSGFAGDVLTSGNGFTNAVVQVDGSTITISDASITEIETGTVQISGLTSPVFGTFSRFLIRTAVEGGNPTAIENSPEVKVGTGEPSGVIPISVIQENESAFIDEEITIEGIVTLGAGITNPERTDAYVQDTSGRGINVFSFDLPGDPPNHLLKRGYQVRITGTIINFNGVTEITEYTIDSLSADNPIPEPLTLTTQQANNTDLEGTYIRAVGEITLIESFNDATNISINDGSGTVQIRVWNSTGINLSPFDEEDTLEVKAVMDLFQNSAQLIPGYQSELLIPGETAGADGSGLAFTSLTTVDTLLDTNLTVSMVGNVEDTIRTVRVDIPKLWEWSGNPGDVSISGSAVNNQSQIDIKFEPIDSLYQVLITGVNITTQDTADISLKNLRTPEEPLQSVFWVKTAGEEGTLRLISAMPKITVGGGQRNLIYDLQRRSSEFSGTVTVRGVTTIGAGLLREVSSGGDSLTTAYIQDESGRGINLFRFGLIDPNLVRGNRVEVSGSVTEFNGVTEIEYTSISLLETEVPLPKPVQLSNREVNSIRWDGTLVKTVGVIVERFSAGGGTSLEISDGKGGTTVRIWDTAELDLSEFNENNRIFVQGVGGLFLSEGDTIFQILSTYQDQIELDPTYSPTLDNVFLETEPHPFAPDQGEQIEITYNAGAVNNRVTIRIFDLAGRLITTLLDEDAQLIENTFEWDGRDQFLEFVPLGTYICHLEVVEPVSGKSRKKLAPIVVGTVLK